MYYLSEKMKEEKKRRSRQTTTITTINNLRKINLFSHINTKTHTHTHQNVPNSNASLKKKKTMTSKQNYLLGPVIPSASQWPHYTPPSIKKDFS